MKAITVLVTLSSIILSRCVVCLAFGGPYRNYNLNGQGLPYNFPFVPNPFTTPLGIFPTFAPAPPIDPRINPPPRSGQISQLNLPAAAINSQISGVNPQVNAINFQPSLINSQQGQIANNPPQFSGINLQQNVIPENRLNSLLNTLLNAQNLTTSSPSFILPPAN